jgi:hypothetical protein
MSEARIRGTKHIGEEVTVTLAFGVGREQLCTRSCSNKHTLRRRTDGDLKPKRRSLGRAGDGSRELIPWTAGPGTLKNLDPEHPLARDSRGRRLALFYISV